MQKQVYHVTEEEDTTITHTQPNPAIKRNNHSRIQLNTEHNQRYHDPNNSNIPLLVNQINQNISSGRPSQQRISSIPTPTMATTFSTPVLPSVMKHLSQPIQLLDMQCVFQSKPVQTLFSESHERVGLRKGETEGKKDWRLRDIYNPKNSLNESNNEYYQNDKDGNNNIHISKNNQKPSPLTQRQPTYQPQLLIPTTTISANKSNPWSSDSCLLQRKFPISLKRFFLQQQPENVIFISRMILLNSTSKQNNNLQNTFRKLCQCQRSIQETIMEIKYKEQSQNKKKEMNEMEIIQMDNKMTIDSNKGDDDCDGNCNVNGNGEWLQQNNNNIYELKRLKYKQVLSLRSLLSVLNNSSQFKFPYVKAGFKQEKSSTAGSGTGGRLCLASLINEKQSYSRKYKNQGTENPLDIEGGGGFQPLTLTSPKATQQTQQRQLQHKEQLEEQQLVFNDDFQSSNLLLVKKKLQPKTSGMFSQTTASTATPVYYMCTRFDIGTYSYGQWFFCSIKRSNDSGDKKKYRFIFVNMTKKSCMIGREMKISVFRQGKWRKQGDNIMYYQNSIEKRPMNRSRYLGHSKMKNPQKNQHSFTDCFYALDFELSLKAGQEIFISFNQPYSYSRLSRFLDRFSSKWQQTEDFNFSKMCQEKQKLKGRKKSGNTDLELETKFMETNNKWTTKGLAADFKKKTIYSGSLSSRQQQKSYQQKQKLSNQQLQYVKQFKRQVLCQTILKNRIECLTFQEQEREQQNVCCNCACDYGNTTTGTTGTGEFNSDDPMEWQMLKQNLRKQQRLRQEKQKPQHKKDDKKIIFIVARAHPIQTASSFVMEGILEKLFSYFLLQPQKQSSKSFKSSSTSSSLSPQQIHLFQNLFAHYIFKVIPMMNPDGVIVGNSRCNLTGVDLNRQWKCTNKQKSYEIVSVKKYLLKYKERIEMFIDIHAHSKKKNVFAYGMHNFQDPYATREFPYILAKLSEGGMGMGVGKKKVQKEKGKQRNSYLNINQQNFLFEQCRFTRVPSSPIKIATQVQMNKSKKEQVSNQKQKILPSNYSFPSPGIQGTARIWLYRKLKIPNIFTIQNSYCSSMFSKYHYDNHTYNQIGYQIITGIGVYFLTKGESRETKNKEKQKNKNGNFAQPHNCCCCEKNNKVRQSNHQQHENNSKNKISTNNNNHNHNKPKNKLNKNVRSKKFLSDLDNNVQEQEQQIKNDDDDQNNNNGNDNVNDRNIIINNKIKQQQKEQSSLSLESSQSFTPINSFEQMMFDMKQQMLEGLHSNKANVLIGLQDDIVSSQSQSEEEIVTSSLMGNRKSSKTSLLIKQQQQLKSFNKKKKKSSIAPNAVSSLASFTTIQKRRIKLQSLQKLKLAKQAAQHTKQRQQIKKLNFLNTKYQRQQQQPSNKKKKKQQKQQKQKSFPSKLSKHQKDQNTQHQPSSLKSLSSNKKKRDNQSSLIHHPHQHILVMEQQNDRQQEQQSHDKNISTTRTQNKYHSSNYSRMGKNSTPTSKTAIAVIDLGWRSSASGVEGASDDANGKNVNVNAYNYDNNRFCIRTAKKMTANRNHINPNHNSNIMSFNKQIEQNRKALLCNKRKQKDILERTANRFGIGLGVGYNYLTLQTPDKAQRQKQKDRSDDRNRNRNQCHETDADKDSPFRDSKWNMKKVSSKLIKLE